MRSLVWLRAGRDRVIHDHVCQQSTTQNLASLCIHYETVNISKDVPSNSDTLRKFEATLQNKSFKNNLFAFYRNGVEIYWIQMIDSKSDRNKDY